MRKGRTFELVGTNGALVDLARAAGARVLDVTPRPIAEPRTPGGQTLAQRQQLRTEQLLRGFYGADRDRMMR